MIATTLAFVRTDGGVVQVEPGQGVPTDALPEHVELLATAGVLAEDTAVEVEESAKPKGRAR